MQDETRLLEIGLLVMNWVPVARLGLILWENEATGSRKVSRYLPGLWDAIFLLKMSAEILESANSGFFRIFTYSRYTATTADMLQMRIREYLLNGLTPFD